MAAAIDDLCSPNDNTGWHHQEYIIFRIIMPMKYYT